MILSALKSASKTVPYVTTGFLILFDNFIKGDSHFEKIMLRRLLEGYKDSSQVNRNKEYYLKEVDVDSEYEISFVMPSSFNKETLPDPNSSNVEIMGRSLDLVACISFGGWATESRVKNYHEKLNNWIEKEGLKIYGKFMVAQYNSPWALPPFRHNEIMVRVNK